MYSPIYPRTTILARTCCDGPITKRCRWSRRGCAVAPPMRNSGWGAGLGRPSAGPATGPTYAVQTPQMVRARAGSCPVGRSALHVPVSARAPAVPPASPSLRPASCQPELAEVWTRPNHHPVNRRSGTRGLRKLVAFCRRRSAQSVHQFSVHFVKLTVAQQLCVQYIYRCVASDPHDGSAMTHPGRRVCPLRHWRTISGFSRGPVCPGR